ncbi:MAG: zinc ribbon domain-containing protein [Clostridiales bacterium]|jgi:DNA-directed RNA polymerase subunit RPC12/RpoP|nr:zinc ribbon domain-containing protein [Clostridiales bacterium]
MLFIGIFGIQDKENNIGTFNNIVCPSCGRLTNFDIHKSYRYFHIFFIPTFKWNVRYIVKTSCCGCLYELDPVVGMQFEKNPDTVIKEENLRQINYYLPFKHCLNCNADIPLEYNYCPYCGGKL